MLNDKCHDWTYLNLVERVLAEGERKKNRTGIDTISTFGDQVKFDLRKGFPLLTTKKVFFKGVVHELLWFLSGSTNIKYLVDNGVHIWDEWPFAKHVEACKVSGAQIPTMDGFLGTIKTSPELPMGDIGYGAYGSMWRGFPVPDSELYSDIPPVDQITKVIHTLKTNPDDRRMIVSAWHPGLVDNCALPPCHLLFQFNTSNLTLPKRLELYESMVSQGTRASKVLDPLISVDAQLDDLLVPARTLNCQMYMRSVDLGLGAPFNIASYALLMTLIARDTNMQPGVLTLTTGDTHVYVNHIEPLKNQMARVPYKSPHVTIREGAPGVLGIKYEDIQLHDYVCHESIRMEVAV
jgi:thymidylate synthase